jgi:hypothetical protein
LNTWKYHVFFDSWTETYQSVRATQVLIDTSKEFK